MVLAQQLGDVGVLEHGVVLSAGLPMWASAPAVDLASSVASVSAKRSTDCRSVESLLDVVGRDSRDRCHHRLARLHRPCTQLTRTCQHRRRGGTWRPQRRETSSARAAEGRRLAASPNRIRDPVTGGAERVRRTAMPFVLRDGSQPARLTLLAVLDKWCLRTPRLTYRDGGSLGAPQLYRDERDER